MLLTFRTESFDLLVFYSVIILNLVLFFEIINIIYIYIFSVQGLNHDDDDDDDIFCLIRSAKIFFGVFVKIFHTLQEISLTW